MASLEEPLTEHRGEVQRNRALGASDDALEGVADRSHVCQMLASLPPRQRTILVMRFFEGRTQTEIGKSLGISQVHVSRLMRTALASLRQGVGGA